MLLNLRCCVVPAVLDETEIPDRQVEEGRSVAPSSIARALDTNRPSFFIFTYNPLTMKFKFSPPTGYRVSYFTTQDEKQNMQLLEWASCMLQTWPIRPMGKIPTKKPRT